MTGISLPTLAGVARMVPVSDAMGPTAVGPNFSTEVFTVPDGRILALDWVFLHYDGGLAPTRMAMDLSLTAGRVFKTVFRESPVALHRSVFLTNTVWVGEGGIIRFRFFQGDGTTNMEWGFHGRLFDWVDVT